MVAHEAQRSLSAGELDRAERAFRKLAFEIRDPRYAPSAIKELAERAESEGDLDRAEAYYRELVELYPGTDEAEHAESRIRAFSEKKIQSLADDEGNITYTVEPGDTLSGLASRYNTTVAMIKNLNGLTSDTIWVGQRLKINTSEFSILVDKSENVLILKKDGEPFKEYVVATGRGERTPEGEFKIVNKMIRPAWTKPGVGVILPDSDEYELGERWMGFDEPGYGIHGTNDESTIGQHVTEGCVRMYNDDVVELYDIVPHGTRVVIVDRRENVTYAD